MSITVKHPTPGYAGPATIRDTTLQFKDGTAEAEEGTNLTAFRRAGYELSRGPHLAMLTVPELRQYAEEREIDLTGASRKDEILQAINEPSTEQ